MKEFFKKYLFVFEWIGAAILIGVGIYVVLDSSILNVFVGLILLVFGLLRLIPLIKTTPDKVLKIMYACEIVINVGAGIFLVIEGGKENSNLNDWFGYMIGGVLMLRGFVHFFATSLRKEPNDYVKFFSHLGLFTVGCFIVARGGFSSDTLAYIILVLAILSALFIGFSGYKHYRNYRYELRAREESKKVVVQDEKQPEQIIEDPKPKKSKIITPEEEKKDEAILS
ncbi:MAG TPA: hypothetical protein PK087_01470 [Bacilli bacterium]|nr:MAG: hypothetical protein BWY97_01267 [Tenericutes bacterium ADurb.BinA124]HNZ50998.1 hypothetical protein [Bacilli bacterium]HOH17971.1 hypothetical protein [Bacilli bacterium]HPX84908.1 hypothetical protein [Bacilli bacterium]HQC74808.1 hypothetical protein [Bacilli bacterium]